MKAAPISLATTLGISVDFFSSGYLDVSVHQVDYEYLALEDGPPIFKQDFTCPALLFSILVPHLNFHLQDYHLLWFNFPENSVNSNAKY